MNNIDKAPLKDSNTERASAEREIAIIQRTEEVNGKIALLEKLLTSDPHDRTKITEARNLITEVNQMIYIGNFYLNYADNCDVMARKAKEVATRFGITDVNIPSVTLKPEDERTGYKSNDHRAEYKIK